MTNDEVRLTLRSLREGAKLSQRALGERLGFTQGWVHKVESGLSGVDLQIIVRWAEVCGYTFDHAFRASSAPEPTHFHAALSGVEGPGQRVIMHLARMWPHLSQDRRATLMTLMKQWSRPDAAQDDTDL